MDNSYHERKTGEIEIRECDKEQRYMPKDPKIKNEIIGIVRPIDPGIKFKKR